MLHGLGIVLAARRRPFPTYRGVDVVLEMIGGDIYRKSLEVLAPGGRLVSLGGAFGAVPDPPPALTDGRKASRFSITNYLKAKPEDFRELAQPPQPRPGEKISSDHRSEFSPGRGASSAAPPRRTQPLRQSRTQDELKEQRAKSKTPKVMKYTVPGNSLGGLEGNTKLIVQDLTPFSPCFFLTSTNTS